MDYLFFSGLEQNSPPLIVVSYDIACQWSVNLALRAQIYPEDFTYSYDNHQFTFVIPKWHIQAHQDSCQTGFSFYYTPRVGRTDGEAPERGWAAMNGLAASTKEMGPGSRRDTLDDHFGDYNWRKTVNIRSS